MPPAVETQMSPVQGAAAARRQRALYAGVAIAALILCFAKPLYDLCRFALNSSLYSHIPLIFCISACFAWPSRRQVSADQSAPRRAVSLSAAALGLALLAGYWFVVLSGGNPAQADYLAVITLSFLLLLTAWVSWFVGKESLRQLAFPLGFLIFAVPFPTVVLGGIETFFQVASAEASYWLFQLLQTPVLRTGTRFQLPGFSMEVAPECSGIHSSLVLFITSIVAGRMFLRSPWGRALFAAFVIPLGIVRNAFRIVTIGMLCVHVDPNMINHWIHHRGGPVFFLLSLIPFFLLLFLLRRSEVKRRNLAPEVKASPREKRLS